MRKIKRFAGAAGALGASALGMSSAHAVDITAATTELTSGMANVETIGASVLGICVVIAVFKYVRKAF